MISGNHSQGGGDERSGHLLPTMVRQPNALHRRRLDNRCHHRDCGRATVAPEAASSVVRIRPLTAHRTSCHQHPGTLLDVDECVRGAGERRDDLRSRRRGEYRRHRCLAQWRCGGPTSSSVVSVVVVILRPEGPPSRSRSPGAVPPTQGRPIRGAGGLVAPALRVLAPSAAQLTYRGGPLLTAVDVATVFWGAAWNEPGAQATAQSLNDFFQFVVASPYLDQLGEYSTAEQKIGRGRYAGTARVTDTAPGGSVTDSAIQEMLQGGVA